MNTAAGIDLPIQEFAIHTQGLSRRYGEIDALVDLNLSVPYGSIFGYLGRNGAGKTTTIRLLTGLAQPTMGRAWVAGHETTNSSNFARSLFGYLPQEPGFYSWMTGLRFPSLVTNPPSAIATGGPPPTGPWSI